MDKGGEEEGEDEMNGESTMETYTLTQVKQIASRNLLWLGELKPGFCNNLEGWDEEGGDTDISMADLCWCLAETNTML